MHSLPLFCSLFSLLLLCFQLFSFVFFFALSRCFSLFVACLLTLSFRISLHSWHVLSFFLSFGCCCGDCAFSSFLFVSSSFSFVSLFVVRQAFSCTNCIDCAQQTQEERRRREAAMLFETILVSSHLFFAVVLFDSCACRLLSRLFSFVLSFFLAHCHSSLVSFLLDCMTSLFVLSLSLCLFGAKS